LDGITTRSLSL